MIHIIAIIVFILLGAVRFFLVRANQHSIYRVEEGNHVEIHVNGQLFDSFDKFQRH